MGKFKIFEKMDLLPFSVIESSTTSLVVWSLIPGWRSKYVSIQIDVFSRRGSLYKPRGCWTCNSTRKSLIATSNDRNESTARRFIFMRQCNGKNIKYVVKCRMRQFTWEVHTHLAHIYSICALQAIHWCIYKFKRMNKYRKRNEYLFCSSCYLIKYLRFKKQIFPQSTKIEACFIITSTVLINMAT